MKAHIIQIIYYLYKSKVLYFFLESFFFPIQMTIVTLLDQLSFKSKVLGYNQSAFFFGNFIEKRKLALSFSHQLKVVTE